MGGIEDGAAHSLFHQRIGDPLPSVEPEPDPWAVALHAAWNPSGTFLPSQMVTWNRFHRVAIEARRLAAEDATEPYLGLATTRQLLEEVKARVQFLLGYAVAQQLYSAVNTALGSTALKEHLAYRTVGIEWKSGHDAAAAAADG